MVDRKLNETLQQVLCNIDQPVLLEQMVQVILDSGMAAEDVPDFIMQSAEQSVGSELLNNLAIHFWQAGSFDFVIPLLERSLNINPDYSDARFNMGYILNAIGEEELALGYLKGMTNKTPEAEKLIHEINGKLNKNQPSFLKEYSVQMLKEEGMKFPVYARSGTSDIAVYRQIFIGRDYVFNLPFTPKLIIDGGANVGYSSILFATTYIEAEIIAVEPDSSNFEVLEYNAAPYGKIHPVRSGLWNKDTFLTVHDVGLDKWGVVVQESNESDPEAFKATTISSLLEGYPNQDIDILKLDIEGAERELFTSNYEEWLGKVKVLIIELHDLIKPGCSMAFFKAISNYPFVTFTRGENLVLIKESVFFPNR